MFAGRKSSPIAPHPRQYGDGAGRRLTHLPSSTRPTLREGDPRRRGESSGRGPDIHSRVPCIVVLYVFPQPCRWTVAC